MAPPRAVWCWRSLCVPIWTWEASCVRCAWHPELAYLLAALQPSRTAALQDFAARVPCTKLLCNRFFRLLRERLAERGIPGDAAPH